MALGSWPNLLVALTFMTHHTLTAPAERRANGLQQQDVRQRRASCSKVLRD